MSKSKEERKAYLRGAISALTEAYQLGPHLDLIALVKKHQRDLAALDVPQLAEHYGADRVEIPAPWEWDETFENQANPKEVLGDGGVTHSRKANRPTLGLRKRKPKRVWFEVEDNPREPQVGGWIFLTPFAYVCAVRHEEFDDAPQIVTQADVDRILGGGK